MLEGSLETVRQVCVPSFAGEYRMRKVCAPDQNDGIRNSTPSGSRMITSTSTSEKGLLYDFALVKAHSTGQCTAASICCAFEGRDKLNALAPARNDLLLNRIAVSPCLRAGLHRTVSYSEL